MQIIRGSSFCANSFESSHSSIREIIEKITMGSCSQHKVEPFSFAKPYARVVGANCTTLQLL